MLKKTYEFTCDACKKRVDTLGSLPKGWAKLTRQRQDGSRHDSGHVCSALCALLWIKRIEEVDALPKEGTE